MNHLARMKSSLWRCSRLLSSYQTSCASRCADSPIPIHRHAWLGKMYSKAAPLDSAKSTITYPLAQPGEGIAECELIQWFVSEGDAIEEFGQLCEVQSDKAAVDISSRYAGVIKRLHHSPGDMVPVGAGLIDIEVHGVDLESAHTPGTQDLSSPSQSEDLSSKVAASPAVRALAKEHEVDITLVSPTGPGNRIMKGDVLSYIDYSTQGRGSRAAEMTQSTSIEGEPPLARPAVHGTDDGVLHVPIRGYHRAMVSSMTAAAKVPIFHFCDEVRVDALIQTQKELMLAAPPGVKVTVLAFAVKALSLALTQHPHINSQISADLKDLIQFQSHNVGIAMATSSGLVVPSIKNVENMSILDVAWELHRLKSAADAAALQPHDLTGATITLSNIGTIGGTYALPLVNPPEAAICALGRMTPLPRYGSSGNVEMASVMNICWGADHRAIDGASLAQFSNTWKSYLQSPSTCLLHAR